MSKNLEIIDSIQEDVNTIISTYPNHDKNLLGNILEDDIPWLINYIQNVENFIKLTERPESEHQQISYISGYFNAVRDLKKMVNEE